MSIDKNIKVVLGGEIPSPTSRLPDNYQFSYMDFTKMEVIGTRKLPNSKQIKDIMNGKQAVIYAHTLSACGENGTFEGEDKFLPMLNSQDKEHYADSPSCFCTPYGTIIPQIIIPSYDKSYVDNGLIFGNDSTQGKKSEENGYNWIAEKITDNASGSMDFNKESSDVKAYGERCPHQYITNANSPRASIDVDGLFHERMYVCDTTESGKGAFAFCYKFIHTNSNDQSKKKPCIAIQLSSSSESSPSATIVIPPTGKIMANVGDNFGEGSFPESESALVPPQCARGIDGLETKPLFMYPVFGGFIITSNAAASGVNNDNSMIFIRYERLNLDARYRAKINGGDVDAIKSERAPDQSGRGEIEQYIDKNDGDELMKWFPAIYQQSQKREQIRISLDDASEEGLDLHLASYMKLYWRRSVGRFAYCPIFFYGHPTFTLFFKGEYIPGATASNIDKSGSETGKTQWNYDNAEIKSNYYFYPIVCSTISGSLEQDWKDLASGYARGASRVVAEPYCNDDDRQETIYKATFSFEATGKIRYPLEIFGAVAVCEKHNIAFEMPNENGNFVTSMNGEGFSGKSFHDDLSNQIKLEFRNGFISEPPQKPEQFDAIPNAITGVNCSFSLDDVSGSLDLDAYALNYDINKLKQQQPVGALCLDIIDEHGVQSPLFRGYGMEVGVRNGGNSNSLSIQLAGVGRKLDDIKLVCCPFWDGDKLIDICKYIEALANVRICMINGGHHPVTSYDQKKTIADGEWYSESNTIVTDKKINHPFFRVPRSFDWRNPAVRFENNTSVLEALRRLGEYTGCKFVVEPDGCCVFYELNDMGYPFYVDNQPDKNAVVIYPSDIVSLDLTPDLDHKYNTIVTMGFLQRKDRYGKVLAEQNVEPGVFYTKIGKNTGGGGEEIEEIAGDILFPWARVNVGVETGMFTNPELAEIHSNRVKFTVSEIYKGNVTVKGRTDINHIYQKIVVNGKYFFVSTISHSIDTQNKTWTTSYGLTRFEAKGGLNA